MWSQFRQSLVPCKPRRKRRKKNQGRGVSRLAPHQTTNRDLSTGFMRHGTHDMTQNNRKATTKGPIRFRLLSEAPYTHTHTQAVDKGGLVTISSGRKRGKVRGSEAEVIVLVVLGGVGPWRYEHHGHGVERGRRRKGKGGREGRASLFRKFKM